MRKKPFDYTPYEYGEENLRELRALKALKAGESREVKASLRFVNLCAALLAPAAAVGACAAFVPAVCVTLAVSLALFLRLRRRNLRLAFVPLICGTAGVLLSFLFTKGGAE